MKLLYSLNSPYARRVRIAIREAGLMDAVEEINIREREEPLETLLAHGVAGKVPVLVTSAGASLCESILITRYLDEMSDGKLLPSEASARERALEFDAAASALQDSHFVRSREKRRVAHETSESVIDLEAERARRLLDFAGNHCSTQSRASRRRHHVRLRAGLFGLETSGR